MKYLNLALIGLFLVSYAKASVVEAPSYSTISELSPKIALQAVLNSNSPLLAVAYCESSDRQNLPSGGVLISKTNDYGLFQVNISWKKRAQTLGYDITTLQGNIDFAEYLYKQDGLKDWSASKWCWSKLIRDA